MSGIAAGYAIVPHFVPDGMWGVKAGAFPRTRFGGEFTFEQSIRAPGGRYQGGDFVVQFPKQSPKKPIPFLHVGAGAFLSPLGADAAWSFGGGVKQYITDRVGVRVGIQDRMVMRYASVHLLDFYGGVVFRF